MPPELIIKHCFNTKGQIETKLDNLSIDDFMQMDQDYFSYPWTSENWEQLRSGTGDYLLSWIYEKSNKEKLIGFSLCLIVCADRFSHLLKIIVTPECQGKGYGKCLLLATQRKLNDLQIDKLYLEVEVGNIKAENLYRSLGFDNVHLKKKFYSNGQDAQSMLLILP